MDTVAQFMLYVQKDGHLSNHPKLGWRIKQQYLAASLKDGLVVPSLIISKLQSMQRQNPLQQAIQEVGRIAKTKHILSYIDDENLRRRVLIGLNKGELLHAMARAVFFGRQGRFMDRGYEAQLNRATALSLILNAMVVWNTRYLTAVKYGCQVGRFAA